MYFNNHVTRFPWHPTIRILLATALTMGLGHPASSHAAESIQDLKTAVESGDVEEKKNAARKLADLGPKAAPAVGALAAALGDGDEDGVVRIWSAIAITRIGPPAKKAVPVLITMLREEDAEIRKNTVAALSAIGRNATEAVPAILTELENRDELKTDIIKALGKIDPASSKVITRLRGVLKDGDAAMTIAAASTLRQMKVAPEECKASLIEVITGKTMRVEAANELAEYGANATGALPALVRMLHDEEAISKVLVAAAHALGAMGPEAMEAVPDLVGALKDKRKRVQKAAGLALVLIYEK